MSTNPSEERSEKCTGLQEGILLSDNFFTNLHVICIIRPRIRSGKEGISVAEEYYTVVVADDEEELREAVCSMIRWEEIGFRLVGSAGNGLDALQLVEQLQPDLLLTDIQMPFITGTELAKSVRELQPLISIAFLSGYDDFEYVEFYDDNDLFYELQEKYQQEEDKHGIFDVQVIAPYKKGKLGTIALNKFISDMNPNERGSLGYAEEDKVMQIRNDYSRGVFNGECGIVRSCGDDFVGVGFGEDYGKDTAGAHHLQALNLYDERSLQDIMLAYASTCHKSQGAEYSVVFIILDDESGNFLLTRRLLYTAVSRGKQKVYIYSSPGCVSKCIKNTSEVQRITKLTQLLQMVNNVSNWDEIDEIPF